MTQLLACTTIVARWRNEINRVTVGWKSLASAVTLSKDSRNKTGWAKEDILMGVSSQPSTTAIGTRTSKN